MTRRAASKLPLVLSIALLASLGGGAAYADLVPSPPPKPAGAKPAAAAPVKPAAAAQAKPGASAAPEQAAPADTDSAADVEAPQLSERAKQLLAIKWQNGPMTGSLGDIAEVAVPEGF